MVKLMSGLEMGRSIERKLQILFVALALCWNLESNADSAKEHKITPEMVEELAKLVRPEDSWAYRRVTKKLKQIKHCATVEEFKQILIDVAKKEESDDTKLHREIVFRHGMLALKSFSQNESQAECLEDENSAVAWVKLQENR